MQEGSRTAGQIVAEVSALPVDQRSSAINRLCGDDLALRQRIEMILEARAIAGGFSPSARELVGQPTSNLTSSEGSRPLREGVGSLVGPYKLLQQLGEGGCGVVFLAEQEKPVRRRVAVKLIKRGMDTDRVVARFEAERQALAMMDHPHIAKVFDAGVTEGGHPYFAMEYVRGEPITQVCDRLRRGLDERLRLFMQVCAAVQHAHTKGVIHRDLKPSNILASIDGSAVASIVPKIIDFGVAKALYQPLTERTLFTERGQFIGTPEYMSPEQAEMSGLDIDTRSDIYALGVLLYELLTGTLPFESTSLRSAGVAEIQRIIRDVEPPKPSTRLTATMGLGGSGTPGSAGEKQPGDAALEIARNRLVDVSMLRRKLRGDLDWIVMKCLEKDRARRYDTADALAADVRRHLAHEPVLAGPPRASYRIGKFVRRNRSAVIASAVVVAALIAGVVGTVIGLMKAMNARDAEVEQRRMAEAVIEFLNVDLLSAVKPEAQGFDVKMLDVLSEASARVEKRFADQPLVEATIRATLGRSYSALGQYGAAQEHLEAALRLRERALGEDDPLTLASSNDLADLYVERGHLAEGEKQHERTLKARQRVLGPDHADTLTSMGNIGALYRRLGRLDEAESHQSAALEGRRRTLGNDHPATLISVNNLAAIHMDQNRPDDAAPLLAEALAGQIRVLPPEHPDMLSAKSNLAVLYLKQGRHDEAEALILPVIEIRKRHSGPNHVETRSALNVLASCRNAQGRADEALRLSDEALAEPRESLSGSKIGVFMHTRGIALTKLARYDEAERVLLEARKVLGAALTEEHPRVKHTSKLLADLYDAWGKPEQAKKWKP